MLETKSELDLLSPYRMCVYVVCRECCQGTHRALLANTLARLIARPDMTLHQLVVYLNARLPPNLQSRFTSALTAVLSADANESTLADEETPLHAGQLFTPRSFVKANSVLGKYLRQVIMSFRLLDFHERALFKTQLRAYLSPLLNVESMACRMGDENMAPGTPPLTDADDALEDDPLLVQEDGALSHTHALAVIGKQLHLLRVNESAALSFAGVELMCDTIETKLSNLTQTHYLRVMNALRMGDGALCERRLHRYFDRLCNTPGEHVDDEMHSLAVQRFASLLHAKVARVLRAYGSAVAHLHECIKKSEEAGDSVCLQFALWEASRLLPLADDAKQLQHLIETASRAETNMPDWQSYRNEWQLELSGRRQLRAVHAHLLLEHDVTDDRREYAMAQLARQSSVALAEGQFSSSVQYAQIVLHMTSATTRYGHRLATQPVAVAYANLAHVAAANAHWSDVQRLIQMAQDTRAQCDVIDVCQAVITHQRCLLNGQIEKARRTIKPLRERHTGTWMVLEALCHLCTDDASTALSTAVDAAKHSSDGLLHSALLVMCSALIQLGDMTAASSCADRVLVDARCTPHVAAVARCKLAAIAMHQNRPDDALRLLESTNGNTEEWPLYNRAVHNMLLGRVMVENDVEKAIDHLTKADEQLRRLGAEVLEMKNLLLMVAVYNKMGDTNARNRHAKRWNSLNAKHEHSRTIPLDF